MRNPEKDAIEIAAKRQKLIETAFQLFTQRTIDQVSLDEIAKQSNVGIATLYRYFGNKLELVIAASVWKWEEYREKTAQRKDALGAELTAGQVYTFFLDAFLDLYRNHRDLLRFNQFFNIYLQGAEVDKTRISSYSEMIDRVADAFRKNWEKGRVDGTLRTDISWQQIFSSTLHLMLSAVTRYAVGLVYQMEEGGNPEQELLLLRDMLLRQYTAVPCGGQTEMRSALNNPAKIP